jgi:ubiquilin
LKDD